jgi:hypothetical protein
MNDRETSADLLPARPRPAALAAWALLACLNLSAGALIASWPERQTDFETMRWWGHQWLSQGSNIYSDSEGASDYPPHAIVVFSPLSLLPAAWAVPLWATFNLALAVAAPYLALRAVRPVASASALVLPTLMFLCWGGFRTLLQFSLLALVFGLLAMVLADRRPNWSGLFLGLALIKPQMSVPFFLWAVLTRRRRILALAVVVVVVGFSLFCLRAHASPWVVVRRYLDFLQLLYTGEAIMVGLAQIRPLVVLSLSAPAFVDTVTAAIVLAMLLAICALGVVETRERRVRLFSAPPLVSVWSLLTFYHLTYGFILLLPLAALLLVDDNPRTTVFRRRLFWALQLVLMFDVPGLWRRFGQLFSTSPVVNVFASHVDRLVMVGLLVCVASLARVETGAANQATIVEK